MDNSTIFNLRFGSNAKLQPSAEELRQFLASKKEGTASLQGDDLAPYWELLTAVAAYKRDGTEGFRNKMLYTVLSHSHFAKPALRAVVEEFKYHRHSLSGLDFKKPSAFIKSAQEEIARLNPKKKEEAARIERMRGMMEERRIALEKQQQRWTELTDELNQVIAYVLENLSKIEKLCKQSITMLASEQVDRKKEQGLIEDIKTEFKERLKDLLHQGTIKPQDLEAAKERVAELSKRTADLIRSDIFTLTRVYETIHEHVGKKTGELRAVASKIEGSKHTNYDDDALLYQEAEKILVALITGCRFDIKAAEISAETENDKMLVEKRREFFDHLVDLLHSAR
jgi:chromosome segregation ATPase